MSAAPRQLRNPGAARFDFLADAIGGGVAPTDIDQCLERRGHFLFIECKRPEQRTPTGQRITFDRLVRPREIRSVRLLIVVGHPPDELHGCRWWGSEALVSATADDVRRLARQWWEWAGRA